MSDVLRTFTAPLESDDRAHMLEDPRWSPSCTEEVARSDGTPVSIEALDDLLRETRERIEVGLWRDDRAAADRWLAPRVHWALRLTRAQASDGGVWLWTAMRYADVVAWRWGGDDVAEVAKDRWTGGVHKQALARLWWGGELFRNGPDYAPVVRAFVRQDLPNSYLHRPFVRCRSLAQALLDLAAPVGRETSVSADQVNDLARAVNLATAGAPPEAEVGHVGDDIAAYLVWVHEPVVGPYAWEALPSGPGCRDTSDESLGRASAIAARCAGYAAFPLEVAAAQT